MRSLDSFDETFLQLWLEALQASLKERHNFVLATRFDVSSGKIQTLEEVGNQINISRERVRQLVECAIGKLCGKGSRAIKAGVHDDPCAKLLMYLRSIIQPDNSDHIERLVSYLINDLGCLPPTSATATLIARFVYGTQAKADVYEKEILAKLRSRLKLQQQEFLQARKQIKTHDKFNQIMQWVIWPTEQIRLSPNRPNIERARSTNSSNLSNVGQFFSTKMGCEVQFESQLECDFLLLLEAVEEVAYYIEQPFYIEYEYNNRVRKYYPDILFVLKDGRVIVVEIKPSYQMALRINLAKWKALREYCANHSFGLLVTSMRESIQHLMKHSVDKAFADALLMELHKRSSLHWNTYQEIRQKFNPTIRDFAAAVLQFKLTWQLEPYFLISIS